MKKKEKIKVAYISGDLIDARHFTMKKEVLKKKEKLLRYVGEKKNASWALYQQTKETQDPILIRAMNKIIKVRLSLRVKGLKKV